MNHRPARPHLIEEAEFCRSAYRAGLVFPPWSSERAELWRISLENFINWFIVTREPMPDFHREWCELITRHQFLCLLAPRDHAKTHIAAICYPLWRICMDANASIMLAASSQATASLALRSIKHLLDGNSRVRGGFGNFRPPGPEKWAQSEIIVARSDPMLKDPTVATVGVGGSILTRRITNGAIIVDDIVQDDEAATEAGRTRLRDWFNGVLIPVLEPDEQLVVIGTRKHYSDLYNPDLYNPVILNCEC